MSNLAQKLAPCPFCGGEAVYCEDDSYNNEHTGCVECDVFFVGGSNTGVSKEQWNRRAPNSEVVGHLEAQHRSAIENGKLRKEKADLVEMLQVACRVIRQAHHYISHKMPDDAFRILDEWMRHEEA